MLLNNKWVNNEIKEEIKKVSGNKWKWTHNSPKPVRHSKGSLKREVHSSTGLPKKDRKISNKEPNSTYTRTRGRTTNICRWHDNVHRKPYRLHQKTTQPNKWIWQNSGIQSQYSEIKGIFAHQQWNIRNRNQEKNPNCYSNEKNKAP